MTRKIRFGIQTPPQNTTWRELRDAWKLIDSLGYDTAWVFDHFFAILSDPTGPCFEGWTSLAALAAETSRIEAGVLVTGNTYRNPAVLAKMAATVDHICNGRLIVGMGAAWFEQEHNAFGIPFYSTGGRIRRFEEALEVVTRMFTESQVTFDGKYYQLKEAFCEPKPVRKPRPPIMIGGSGEKLMLRLVAKYADIWNTFGSPEVFKHKIGVLGDHCAQVGRNIEDIEISWAGATFITSSKSERDERIRRTAAAFGRAPEEVEAGFLVGSLSEVQDRIAKLIDVGVTHFIMIANPPFEAGWIRSFAEEVIPVFRT